MAAKRAKRHVRNQAARSLGLSAEQVCSTHGWQAAQFDPDVLAQTQALCGNHH
jgi:hypothetical protein